MALSRSKPYKPLRTCVGLITMAYRFVARQRRGLIDAFFDKLAISVTEILSAGFHGHGGVRGEGSQKQDALHFLQRSNIRQQCAKRGP